MSYIDLIKEKAKADRKTIVLPETNNYYMKRENPRG